MAEIINLTTREKTETEDEVVDLKALAEDVLERLGPHKKLKAMILVETDEGEILLTWKGMSYREAFGLFEEVKTGFLSEV